MVELLIVMGIFMVLAAVTMPVYGDWQRTVQLDTALQEIGSGLRRAQAKSLSGENDSAHGVYFSATEGGGSYFVIYQGDNYAARTEEYDAVSVWPDSLVLSLGIGGEDINFSQGRGLPSASGNIVLEDSGTGETGTTTINNWGIIE